MDFFRRTGSARRGFANVVFRLRAGKLERVPALNTPVWAARAEPDGSWRMLMAYTTEHWDGKKLTTTGRLPPGDGAYQAFAIAPAWWATRWAWAGWSALGLAGVAGVVRLRTHALHRRAERLETIVADRTRELDENHARLATQNTELARLRQLELDEKVAAQLAEEKARLELLRYQLNPHFLLNAFTTLRSLVFSAPEAAGKTVERLDAALRRVATSAGEPAPAPAGLTLGDLVHLKVGNGTTRFVAIADIVDIGSDENYTAVRLAGGLPLRVRRTLQSWEDSLPAAQFARVHRTTIVNLTRYRGSDRQSHQTTLIHLEGLAEPVPASFRYLPELRARLAALGREL